MATTKLQNFPLKVSIILLLCFWFTIPNFFAQTTRELVQEDAGTQNRIALVIGNGAYDTAPLRNPVNDANDMAAALRALGFEVQLYTDITQNQMKRAISDFGRKLRDRKATGLFYFAGHGVQVRGKNYLIPVGARVDTEEDVEYEGVDVGRLLAQMRSARNSMNIVILDACRNNPFARSFRSAEKGLASIDAPSGTIIAYSTAPGAVASDGEGRNGLYTQELLKEIKTPGLSIETVFKRVRVSVREQTETKQTPWESSSLTGEFYFAEQKKQTAVKTEKQIQPTVVENTRPATSETKQLPLNLDSDALTLAMVLTGLQSRSGGFSLAEKNKFITTSVKQRGITFVLSPLIEAEIKRAGGSEELLKAIKEKQTVSNIPKTKPAENTEKSLESETFRKNSIGMEFVWIPPGEFLMGSPANEEDRDEDEGPQRKVIISDGFWFGKYEVTQGQYEQIMRTNPSKYTKCGANCPVERVTWYEAKEFIKRLNAKDDKFVYSLPTEAEWEYAARAGTKTRYSFGDSSKDLKNYGRQGKTSGTHPVGELLPNPWGIYDIYGNVREWVEDIYNEAGYEGLPTDGSANLTIGDKTKRVLRGGSWIYFSQYLRSANRFMNDPTERDSGIGFRIVARQKKVIYKIPLS